MARRQKRFINKKDASITAEATNTIEKKLKQWRSRM